MSGRYAVYVDSITRLSCPFAPKVVVYGHCLATLPLTVNQALNPNTKRFKRTLIYFLHGLTVCKFWGKSPLSATKRHLTDKRSKTMKNENINLKINKNKIKRLILFGISFYSLFGALNIPQALNQQRKRLNIRRRRENKKGYQSICF